MADDKFSLSDLKDVKDSFDSIKSDLNKDDNTHYGGNDYKNYDHNGNLADDISNGKEKLGNAIDKAKDIGKNIKALDKMDKAAGGKGLKNGAEGLKNLAAGGDKTKAALGALKDNLKKDSDSSGDKSDKNKSSGGDSKGEKGTAEKMVEAAQKTSEEAKLAIKMAAKIASQNYVGAAIDALKNPAAFARLLKKILLIIITLICIITLVIMLPIILIACLFFWLLPGATTNSASKENPDVAVKDMSDGEKDVLKDDIGNEDMDKDMEYTIEKQYEQLYNVVYNKCEEIFSTKEDEFKKAIQGSLNTHNKYSQELVKVNSEYGSNLTSVYFNNLNNNQKSSYKVYSDVKKQWVTLDNHGFSPELKSFNTEESLRSFYDHADLDTIADDIAYIMACYTVANGDCAPLSEGSPPSETTSYKDEFEEACEKKKVTENLFKLETKEDFSKKKRTMPSLSYHAKNWNAFLTADEIFAAKDSVSGYSEDKYPRNVKFFNLINEYNDKDKNLIGEYEGYSLFSPGSRGSNEKFSPTGSSSDKNYYKLKMGANVDLKNESYKFHIGSLTVDKNKSYDCENFEPYGAFSIGATNIVAKDISNRYNKISVPSSSFIAWLNNNKTLNGYSIVAKSALDAGYDKNYFTTAEKLPSYELNNKGEYIASPVIFKKLVVSYSELQKIVNTNSYIDEDNKNHLVSMVCEYPRDASYYYLMATYDDDKNKKGGKNVYLFFEDISLYMDEYKARSESHIQNSFEIMVAEKISSNLNYYTGEQKSILGIAYRFKIKFSNMQVPIIENKEFQYDDYYLIATVDGFDRDLITQNMFIDSELYKDRLYDKNKPEDMELENKLFLKDIPKGDNDEETVKNILNATWYSYDENFVYDCIDGCSGCCIEKEGATAATKSTKDPDEYSEDIHTDGWERIDNSKKDAKPGKGQHSKDTQFCTGTSDTCEYCGAEVKRWCSVHLFGWRINLGSAKKVKIINPEEEKEKCIEVNKNTGKPEKKEVTHTVKKKIDWFVENILNSVENAKSLRTVAANSTSDVAIVAKALQYQGYSGGDKIFTFMGVDKYSDYKIWNAAFISFCASKCEISEKIIPKTFSIQDFQEIDGAKIKYKTKNISLDDLKTGDIVYIHDTSIIKYTKAKYSSALEKEQNASEADGIALVVSVDKTNKKVNVIEGCAIAKDMAFKQYYYGGIEDPLSKSNPKSRLSTGGMVAQKQYTLEQITGYTRPAYDEPRGIVQIAVALIGENIGSSVDIGYANFSSNKLVIGYYKWTGNDAFKLLKRIYSMDANAFLNLLKDNDLKDSTFHKLIKEDDDPDKRNNFGAGLSASQRTKILNVCKQMLQSPSGLIASESQKLYDMAKYMEKVKLIYNEDRIKVLMTDLMFAERNPLLLETEDWAKNFQGYFSSNFGSSKDSKALDVAKQYFVTDAKKNGVPSNIAQRAKDDIAYLAKIPDEQFKEKLTEEEQKQAEKNAETMENFKNGTVPTFTKPVSPINPKK